MRRRRRIRRHIKEFISVTAKGKLPTNLFLMSISNLYSDSLKAAHQEATLIRMQFMLPRGAWEEEEN